MYIPFFKIAQWVAMATTQFHITKTYSFLVRFFNSSGLIKQIGMHKIVIGVQCRSNYPLVLELVYQWLSVSVFKFHYYS